MKARGAIPQKSTTKNANFRKKETDAAKKSLIIPIYMD